MAVGIVPFVFFLISHCFLLPFLIFHCFILLTDGNRLQIRFEGVKGKHGICVQRGTVTACDPQSVHVDLESLRDLNEQIVAAVIGRTDFDLRVGAAFTRLQQYFLKVCNVLRLSVCSSLMRSWPVLNPLIFCCRWNDCKLYLLGNLTIVSVHRANSTGPVSSLTKMES